MEILCVGVAESSFYTMLIGRFVFGIGAESSYVAQDSVIASWFNGQELGLAMGIAASAAGLVSKYSR
jgi:MFS family permease